MLACLQLNQNACCRWQPHIALIDKGYSINQHIMTVAHGAQIQKKRISACGGHAETPGVEHLILSNALSTLGSGHLGHQALSQVALVLLHQINALVRRIVIRSEEHTSELQSRPHLVCRLLLEK